MDKAIVSEAKKFFTKIREYCESFLLELPEKRKRLRWYHYMLGIKPRGTLYEETMRDCERGLEALDNNDVATVVSSLDKLIQWCKIEGCRFGADPMAIWITIDILASLRLLRLNLLEQK